MSKIKLFLQAWKRASCEHKETRRELVPGEVGYVMRECCVKCRSVIAEKGGAAGFTLVKS